MSRSLGPNQIAVLRFLGAPGRGEVTLAAIYEGVPNLTRRQIDGALQSLLLRGAQQFVRDRYRQGDEDPDVSYWRITDRGAEYLAAHTASPEETSR